MNVGGRAHPATVAVSCSVACAGGWPSGTATTGHGVTCSSRCDAAQERARESAVSTRAANDDVGSQFRGGCGNDVCGLAVTPPEHELDVDAVPLEIFDLVHVLFTQLDLVDALRPRSGPTVQTLVAVHRDDVTPRQACKGQRFAQRDARSLGSVGGPDDGLVHGDLLRLTKDVRAVVRCNRDEAERRVRGSTDCVTWHAGPPAGPPADSGCGKTRRRITREGRGARRPRWTEPLTSARAQRERRHDRAARPWRRGSEAR